MLTEKDSLDIQGCFTFVIDSLPYSTIFGEARTIFNKGLIYTHKALELYIQ